MAYDMVYFSTTSSTYYGQVVQRLSLKIWDVANAVLSLTPTYTDTDIAMTEIGSAGVYGFTFPSGLPEGDYYVIFKKQAGGTAAASDTVVGSKKVKKKKSGFVVEEGEEWMY